MANPQCENGHTKVANEIMEAIAKTHLSDYESRIIHALWRKTYGWHKKADHISYSQWEELTGIDRRHTARTLKHLVARKIIAQSGNGYHIEYIFQKDYSLWQALPQQATVRGQKALPIQDRALPQQATGALPQQAPTKAIKAINKSKGRRPFKIHELTEEEKGKAMSLLEKEGDREVMAVLFRLPAHWGKSAEDAASEYTKIAEQDIMPSTKTGRLNEAEKFRIYWQDRSLQRGWLAWRNWVGKRLR